MRKKIRMLWSIIKRCNFEKIVIGFFISFFAVALIVWLREPAINTYGNALWYCFVSCTTIGFGDMVTVTHLGRILTVYLTIYEIVLIALMSGVIVSYYLEVIHRRERLSATVLQDKMEHLTELDYDELKEIQEKVKSLKM